MSTITLPNIRVSSDLTVKVRLKDSGVAIDWSTLNNVKASIYSDAQRALAGRCDVSIDAEDPTLLVCQYAANKPQYVGVNRIVVSAKYHGETKTYDKPAFSFVRWTGDQAGEQITIDDPDVDVEIDVEDVSSSILDEAIRAAFAGAERANDAADSLAGVEADVEAAEALRVAAEESRVEAEEDRVEAEAARVDEEAVRVSAEDARVVAENAREAAEDLREGAEDDRAAAETARETAEASRVAAEALRVSAEGSRESAEAARASQASTDHTTAASDHTQAAADHTQAAADHTTAASDHTQASSDHTLAAADHTTAAADHTQAQADHAVMEGYDDRLDSVESEVSQLEAEVTELADNQTIDVTGTGTYQTGRVFTNGIFPSYTSYRYMLYNAKKGDSIHYKAMADTSTIVFGKQDAGGTTYTAIKNGAGTSDYVEGDYIVSEDSVFVICGYINKQTVSIITRDGRIPQLEDEVSAINARYTQDIPEIRNSIEDINVEVGLYKTNEDLTGACSVLSGNFIGYDGNLSTLSTYSVLYLPVENAVQLKNKGGLGANTAIAFYSGFPFSSENLVEIHKYSDYSPQEEFYTDEITLSVPSGAKYFAYSLWNAYQDSDYVKASQVAEQTGSINTRLMDIEKEDISGLKSSLATVESEIGIYPLDKNLIGYCEKLAGTFINYNGVLSSFGSYSVYSLPIENASQIKVKGGFGANTSIAFYSSENFGVSSLVEIHKYSDYSPQEEFYTDEITLSVPTGAKYFAFSLWNTYQSSAYVKASQVVEQDASINTRISTLEEGASSFFVDPTLHLEGITENPLALIKKNGGLASAFESWGFIGDSLASGSIWGWLNVPKTLVGEKTNKMVDASGNIVDASGYIIGEPMQGQTYRPKFIVEFSDNTGLSSSMCVIAKCDASGNILAVGAVGGSATKYEFSVMDNQYVVVCYPSGNIPSVRCVSSYVEENHDISWGQYMCRICGTQGVNYTVGGGTVKKFVLNQGPFDSTNSLAKLKSDTQKQGYIMAFGVNDRDNSMYDANVTDIEDIGADVNLADPTQNANTFAGYYARAIQEIKATFPDSFIFLVTIPESSEYDEMNTIIRAMPGIFENTYNSIYVLDLKEYVPASAVRQFQMNGIHLNAQGYVYFAYAFCTYIDWLIRTYPNEFKGVSLIGKALLNNPS